MGKYVSQHVSGKYVFQSDHRKTLGNGKFFLLILDNCNFSGFLSSSQMCVKGKVNSPQTQTVWIDLYCLESSVSKPSVQAKCCSLHPEACCQRPCRLPSGILLRCVFWHSNCSPHPTSLAFRVVLGSLSASNLYVP